MAKISTHKDLRVYQLAFELSMKIYKVSKSFPVEEKYSMTDQVRRSSRSVCANLAEAYRKRRYPKNFVSKLSDCEAEAAETDDASTPEATNIPGKPAPTLLERLFGAR